MAGFSTTAKNLAVDAVTGVSPAANRWIGVYSGDPASGGTLVGSRVAMSPAFPAASGGSSSPTSGTVIPVAASATFSWIGIFDHATAGNLLHSYDIPDETYGSAGTYTADPTISA